MNYRRIAVNARTFNVEKYSDYPDLIHVRNLARDGDVLYHDFDNHEYAIIHAIISMNEVLSGKISYDNPYKENKEFVTEEKIKEVQVYLERLKMLQRKISHRRCRRLRKFALMFKMIKDY